MAWVYCFNLMLTDSSLEKRSQIIVHKVCNYNKNSMYLHCYISKPRACQNMLLVYMNNMLFSNLISDWCHTTKLMTLYKCCRVASYHFFRGLLFTFLFLLILVTLIFSFMSLISKFKRTCKTEYCNELSWKLIAVISGKEWVTTGNVKFNHILGNYTIP